MDTACSDSDEIKGARNGVTSWPCILKPGFAQFVIMMVTAVNHRDSTRSGETRGLARAMSLTMRIIHWTTAREASRPAESARDETRGEKIASLLRAVHGQA